MGKKSKDKQDSFEQIQVQKSSKQDQKKRKKIKTIKNKKDNQNQFTKKTLLQVERAFDIQTSKCYKMINKLLSVKKLKNQEQYKFYWMEYKVAYVQFQHYILHFNKQNGFWYDKYQNPQYRKWTINVLKKVSQNKKQCQENFILASKLLLNYLPTYPQLTKQNFNVVQAFKALGIRTFQVNAALCILPLSYQRLSFSFYQWYCKGQLNPQFETIQELINYLNTLITQKQIELQKNKDKMIQIQNSQQNLQNKSQKQMEQEKQDITMNQALSQARKLFPKITSQQFLDFKIKNQLFRLDQTLQLIKKQKAPKQTQKTNLLTNDQVYQTIKKQNPRYTKFQFMNQLNKSKLNKQQFLKSKIKPKVEQFTKQQLQIIKQIQKSNSDLSLQQAVASIQKYYPQYGKFDFMHQKPKDFTNFAFVLRKQKLFNKQKDPKNKQIKKIQQVVQKIQKSKQWFHICKVCVQNAGWTYVVDRLPILPTKLEKVKSQYIVACQTCKTNMVSAFKSQRVTKLLSSLQKDNKITSQKAKQIQRDIQIARKIGQFTGLVIKPFTVANNYGKQQKKQGNQKKSLVYQMLTQASSHPNKHYTLVQRSTGISLKSIVLPDGKILISTYDQSQSYGYYQTGAKCNSFIRNLQTYMAYAMKLFHQKLLKSPNMQIVQAEKGKQVGKPEIEQAKSMWQGFD